MTTVTITEQAATSAAGEGENSVVSSLSDGVLITDSKGRLLKLKQPNLLQESRLVRALGDAASNAAYLNAYVMPAALVIEINGEHCLFPGTQREIDASIQSLGREGMAAVASYITDQAGKLNEESALKK